MINKIINNDSFDFNAPVAQLMDVHSKGVDSKWMNKRASVISDVISSIRPVEGKTHIHLITTGALESYGSNCNADGFNREAREYNIPYPEKGTSKVIMLKGGLKENHKSYMKTGNVYKNHSDNRNPDNASGKILCEMFNEPMDRGELVIQVDNDKWGREIECLSNNDPVYFSQGCSVRQDTCSVCGHKRSTIPQSCDHLKYNKLALTPEGHQVFAINDEPVFHDISGVIKPADKIAFALSKVASQGILGGEDLAQMYGYSSPTSLADTMYGKAFDKYAMLVKLAKMEKEVECKAEGTEAFSEGSGFKEISENTIKSLSDNFDGGMHKLKEAKVILPIELFMKLVMNQHKEEAKELIPEVKQRLPNIFNTMLNSDNVGDIMKDGTYDGRPGLFNHLNHMISSMIPSQGLDFNPVKKRISIMSIRRNPSPRVMIIKTASDNAAADMVAEEYGKYLLSFNRGLTDNFIQKQSIIQKLV